MANLQDKLMGHNSRARSTFIIHGLRTIAFSCLLLRGAALLAQEKGGCNSAVTTAAMLNCEHTRYDKAQADLNAVYQRLLKKQDAMGKAKLRAAQIAWLQFRKTNADFVADAARGGTMAPLITLTTFTDMTEARANDLRRSLQ